MKKTTLLTLLVAAGLALSGCAAGGAADSSSAGDAQSSNTTPEHQTAAEITRDDCDGVWAVVDFGDLATAPAEACVDTAEPITAIAAFEQAGFELEGVQTSDQFFACRINGVPDAQLTFEGETYEAHCNDFGPAWAWWGLFIDTGAGWEFALEGAELQEVAPGEAIAFAWQFGDTTDPRLPA